MAILQDVAERHRQELLAREAVASRELVASYGRAYRQIQDMVAAVGRKIQRARDAGTVVNPAWLSRQDELRMLVLATSSELGRFAANASEIITREQHAVVLAAQANAEELTELALEAPSQLVVGWNQVPPRAVEELAGNLADGSPLHSLLSQLAGQGVEVVKETVLANTALGLAPIDLARKLRDQLGVNLSRAQTISRTETLRAYRESTRQSFLANPRLVRGWVWHASLSARTCATCWAMNGTEHAPEETLDGHPNCRCAMVPLTPSWKDIGIEGVEDVNNPIEPGVTAFDKASEETKKAVLGPGGYAAYQRGEVKLTDFVGQKQSDQWGSMRYQRSLADARQGGGSFNAPGSPSQNHQGGGG